MKYMLLVYGDENALDDVKREACYREATQVAQEIQRSGNYLASSPLQPTATATSVQVRDGKRLITDGPFAETHEQLGGYFLIEARDLDEATSIAARLPMARWGTIEVRPLVDLGAMPPFGSVA